MDKGTIWGLVGTAAVVGGLYLGFSGKPEETKQSSLDVPTNTVQTVRARTDDPETTRSFEETGDRDCGDFASQRQAQAFFESEGGPASDFHNLDRDGDGVACE